jgi:voltage-gated potassium channel
VLPRITEKNNFAYLAVGLIVLLFVGAMVEHFPGNLAPRIIQATTIATLFAMAFSQKSSQSGFIISISFVLVILLSVAGGVILDKAGFGYAHLLIMLSFFIWVTWQATRRVLFTGTIDGNKIVGAICIYLLLGLIWAILYVFIAEIIPGAFNGIAQAPWIENFATAIYFSFVTITTLGYGDISPAMPLARFLVFMEAVIGVFYMAILVASLIGVSLADRDTKHK